MDYQKLLIEKFFPYLAIPSQSEYSATVVPSTKGQYELASKLKEELIALGIEEVELDSKSILTAKLRGDKSKRSLGFCAHLDTVDVGLSPVIKPQILHFEGKPLILNKKENIVIDPKTHPELLAYKNEDIIFSDGTSVLGADNKAAIAIIMTLLEYLVKEKIPHGDILVSFVPDEEIGLRGSKILPLERFNPSFAYTIDSCEIGELVYETFNASHAILTIEGVSAHPMNAKGVLLNPTLIAYDVISCFCRLQTPENTEGREGYIWINEMHSNQRFATLNINIRDHDKAKYEKKKEYIGEVVAFMQKRYERAKFSLRIIDDYANLKDSMNEDSKESILLLKEAFKICEIEPNIFPMRGGTDGSALSIRGLFVPNFFTGAHNFHSAFEFLPIKSFYKSFEVAKTLVELV